MIGRTFRPGEDPTSIQNVAVISESLWKRRFASNPGIIGQTITLDGEAHTVVGVMPSSFRFPPSAAIPPELWVPLKFTKDQQEKRGSHWMWVVGRLKPGVSVEAAHADMNAIASQLAKQYPKEQTGRRILLHPLHGTVAQGVRPALLVLMSAVGLVLLIAPFRAHSSSFSTRSSRGALSFMPCWQSFILAVVIAASLVPARRAMQVDPIVALRWE